MTGDGRRSDRRSRGATEGRAGASALAAAVLLAAGTLLGGAGGVGSARAEPAAAASSKATPAPLPGKTVDYPYDGKDVGKPRLAWTGRAFVHDRAAEHASRGEALPLVVFLHGLNKELIPHRWMGGGNEGDVRRLVAALIDSGAIPPVVVAGPGSVVKEAVARGASFPEIDVDHFVERTAVALGPSVRIDPARVVVLGHSGAGCSDRGGIVAALRMKRAPLGVVSIDTCMGPGLARDLAAAPPATHVVVTWQDAGWTKRPFAAFRATFASGVAAHPPAPGALRELDRLPALPRAHDATVGQTLAKWLPRLLVPAAPP